MRVGPFEVLHELGRGANGVVFAARDSGGREVAVKLLHARSDDAIARFARERKVLASLGRAEGFVPLLDAGESAQGAWLALELVTGGTLRQRLARGRLPLDETTAIAQALAAALARAHALGIVHRDLKPENVLFTDDGRPLVADLGLAKRVDGGATAAPSLSVTGSFRGTVGYLSPEQARDAKSVGPATDVFAWGAIVYECLADAPAFRGTTVVEVLSALDAGTFEPLARACPGAPRALAAVVERALERDPSRRYPDGAELVRALDAALESSTKGRLRPGPRALVVACVGGVALATLVAWAATRGGAPPPAPVARPGDASRVSKPGAPPGGPDRGAARRELERGVALREKGDKAAALEAFARASELDPTWGEPHAERGSTRGRTREDAELALRDFDEALARDPESRVALLERPVALHKVGRFQAAIDAAQRYRSVCGENAVLLELEGEALLRLGRKPEAGACFDRAVKVDPRSLLVRRARAAYRALTNDFAGAESDLTTAVELDPELAELFRDRARVRLERGDNEGAADDAQRSVELRADDATGWAVLARARNVLQQFAEAEAAGARAIELDPAPGEPYFQRARALAGLGRNPEAERSVTIALERLPAVLVPGLLLRSQVREKSGDRAGAIADLEKLLAEAPPDHAGCKVARSRLERLRAAEGR